MSDLTISDVGLFWFLVLVVLAIAYAAFVPLALIWALNTLFKLGIDFNWNTWVAALILSSPFTTSSFRGKKGK